MKRYSVSYVEVWNGSDVLASWSCENQNYGSIESDIRDPKKGTFHRLIKDLVIQTVKTLPGNKVTKSATKLIEAYDCYYTTAEDGKVIICFVKENVPKILPLRLLSDLKDLKNDNDKQLGANIEEVSNNFHQELLSYRTEGHETAASTEAELQRIIEIMNDNIDKFLQRQERISLLVDNTNQLNENSFKFQRKSSRIMRKMWWNNAKIYSTVAAIVLVILGALLLILLKD